MAEKAILLLASIVLVASTYDDEYFRLGCYKDTPESRAISEEYIEFGEHTVELCFRTAKRKGYEVFAIESQTHCYTSTSAHHTFNKFGLSKYCSGGRGGYLAMDVYEVRTTTSFLLNKIHVMANESRYRQYEIDALQKDVGKKQRNIDILTKDIKDLSSKTAYLPYGPYFFPKGTTGNVGFKEYPMFGATLIGFGDAVTDSARVGRFNESTLEECVRKCYGYYAKDPYWNGFIYVHALGHCYCYKTDTGHFPRNDFLHYRFHPTTDFS